MVDARINTISESIRVIPHFPKEGIMFQDVTTLLLHPEAFQHSIDILYEHYKDQKVNVIAGE
jgi:adenine phosphoribosyltransferase